MLEGSTSLPLHYVAEIWEIGINVARTNSNTEKYNANQFACQPRITRFIK
jgi:hypothetical protein